MAVYACADLHGNGVLWDKIKEFLKPEDTLYFLGDANDRGLDGVRIALELLQRKNTIYLIGNHEDMMFDCLQHSYDIDALYMWYKNGGSITHQNFKELNDNDKTFIVEKLDNLPEEEVYVNSNEIKIHLAHAGFSLKEERQFIFREDILWDRSHFLNDEEWNEELFPSDVVVHGHTIVPSLLKKRKKYALFAGEKYDEINYDYLDPKILKYCNGHKIDIDLGSAFSGKACLLNLDTFEEVYFYDDKTYQNYLTDCSRDGGAINYWS